MIFLALCLYLSCELSEQSRRAPGVKGNGYTKRDGYRVLLLRMYHTWKVVRINLIMRGRCMWKINHLPDQNWRLFWICDRALNPSCGFHTVSQASVTESETFPYLIKLNDQVWHRGPTVIFAHSEVFLFFLNNFPSGSEGGGWGRRTPVQPDYQLINTESRSVSLPPSQRLLQWDGCRRCL